MAGLQTRADHLERACDYRSRCSADPEDKKSEIQQKFDQVRRMNGSENDFGELAGDLRASEEVDVGVLGLVLLDRHLGR
jgi:hypothetical protein